MDYSKLGITQIDEQEKAGSDVKYDEDFEKIEFEISKLTSPTISNEVDWNLVVKLAENILETKSKNLLVSVYLSYALFKVRGVEGLSDGIMVLSDLLENYWEIMYPPLRRIRGRKNAIEWLLDRLNKEFETIEMQDIDEAIKDKLLSNLRKIDSFLDEHMEDSPLFYNLINLVDTKLISLAQQQEAQQEAQQQEVQQQEAQQEVQQETQKQEAQQQEQPQVSALKHPENTTNTQDTSTQDTSFKLSGDDEKDFKSLIGNLGILIGKMIEAKDYRTELFVINRAFAWLDIQDVPSSTNNETMLPPPDEQEIAMLQKLYDEKDFESLLWMAESRITTYLFWLDLHFYVAKSLENLGFKEASLSVLEQVSFFIQKLPNLENLTFSNSIPFANQNTKKWLKSKENKQIVQNVSSAKDDDKIKKVECTPEGIDELSLLMKNASCVEDEILYNIEICKCISKNNNEILSAVYTKNLLDKIEQYKVDRYKPKVALEAYLAVLGCLDDTLDEGLIKELHKKIAFIKPSFVG